MMRLTGFALAAALLASPALAGDPTGTWKSEVNDEGSFIIVEVAACANAAAKLCGTIIEATNEDPTKTDEKRRAELVGKVMIKDMEPDGENAWSNGTIWAPDDDETYSSEMELKGNILEVSGCVLGGLICRGQDWTRAN